MSIAKDICKVDELMDRLKEISALVDTIQEYTLEDLEALLRIKELCDCV